MAVTAASKPGSSRSGAPSSGVDAAYLRCRDLDMRLSRQRRMVLELLWDEKEHLSARDIFEKLNARGRNIGHTSVDRKSTRLNSSHT